MDCVVFCGVIELLLDSPAYLDLVFGRDRDVSTIKQSVDVLSKEKSICRRVCSSLGVRSNVGGVENVEDVRRRERTGSGVCIGDEHPKGTLTESRQQNLWLSVFCDLNFDGLVQGWCRLRKTGFNLGPNLGPSRFLRLVTLAAYGRPRPIGNLDPLRFGEKEGLLEEYAADDLLAAGGIVVAIAPHPILHLVQCDCAVL